MHVIFVKKEEHIYARVEEMKSFYGWHGNILHGWMNSTSSYIDLDFLLFGFSGLREEAFLCEWDQGQVFITFFSIDKHRHRAIIYPCQMPNNNKSWGNHVIFMERNRGGGVVNMNGTRLVSVLALLAACQLVTSSRITMDQDGGYKRIVVKISKDVPEAHCPTLLKNIKVGLNQTRTITILSNQYQYQYLRQALSQYQYQYSRWA